MSLFIIASQSARIAATWSSSIVTKRILLTASIILYTALLYQREQKIQKYYATRPDRLPTGGSREAT